MTEDTTAAGALDAPAEPDQTTLQRVDEDAAVVANPNARGGRWPLLVAAPVLAIASLFGPLSASGIWEPPELKVAEFGRRIAVTLLGAKGLIIDGAVNTVPTAGEIGRGELPLTFIAVGFRLFGLNEWAGRLPMALWGLIGIGATYVLLARLVDRVAAAFAVIVLATSPLFFLQSRTMLGDIVAMSSLALAVMGLSLAVFDTRLGVGPRIGAWLLGALGLAAGFGTRGVLFGIAVPTLAIACSFVLLRRSSAVDRLSTVFAALIFTLGAAALAIGLRALVRAEDHQYVRLLGCTIDHRRSQPTHDALILQLGHRLFPWSAVIPFALGRLLRRPIGDQDAAFERQGALRTVLLVVLLFAFGACAGLSSWVGVIPFPAVFALAAATAIALRDFELGAPGSRAVALGVVALVVLFCTDFKNFPEKGLSAFVVDDGRFPDSFKEKALKIVQFGGLASAALFALFFFERDEGQPLFDPEERRTYVRELRTSFGGNVQFGLVAAEAGLVVVAAVALLNGHVLHVRQIDALAASVRMAAKVGFAVLPVLVALPIIVMLVRDVTRFALRRLRVTRASAALVSIAAFGAVMSFAYYPLLARQTSPKEVFESYRRLGRPGEELAMVGTSAGSGGARYYAHGDVRALSGTQEAFTWLTENDAQRRWLVVRAADIAQLNSQFRAKGPPRNLPVLDSRSSEILLVSNQLRSGEVNQNPFSKWVLDARPHVQHPIDVDFNGQLQAFGWSVTTKSGELAPQVQAGKPYFFHLYYEVTRAIAGEWQTFIHIDGYQRRFNGDHETLEGKYPFRLWRQGDVIEDIYPFELEPNFAGGTYTVYFGLFRGDQRLEVKRGPAQDNRVNAGPLDVH